jgi:hypothetical protein
MNGETPAQATAHRYGPLSLVSALVSVLAAEFAGWFFAIPYVILTLIYVLPVLAAIDLVVYFALATRPGTAGQVGRGILIGSLSVPVSLVVFTLGFMAAQAIGPI